MTENPPTEMAKIWASSSSWLVDPFSAVERAFAQTGSASNAADDAVIPASDGGFYEMVEPS